MATQVLEQIATPKPATIEKVSIIIAKGSLEGV
jgi:hypothetical protein